MTAALSSLASLRDDSHSLCRKTAAQTFLLHHALCGDGAKISVPPSCKNLHYTHNPYRRAYDKKSDIVIPNAVRNLIRSLIYSLPAFLFPSLLCVPFGMTVVPLSQIPSPYPFYIHPVPTGDGAKFSEYPSCKNLHYTHNPYRRAYDKE